MLTTTVKYLDATEAIEVAHSGAAFVDLRTVTAYLEVHIPGSLALLYERGPGMAVRARDCLPLELPLVLLDLGELDIPHAAASLRGKGFSVVGALEDGINQWVSSGHASASTDAIEAFDPPPGTLLDVDDPGAPRVDGAKRIPIETLWPRVAELHRNDRVVIAAGYGVRAALAVGILERAGHEDIAFWKMVDPARSPAPGRARKRR